MPVYSYICDCPSKNPHSSHQNWIQFYCHTINIYPSPVYQVLNFNWSAFLKGILPTLQAYGWNNGTHGERQLGSGAWACSHWLCVAHYCVIGYCVEQGLLMECPKWWFLPPPTPPTPPHPTSTHSIPPHPTPPPIPPTASIVSRVQPLT